MLISTSGSLKIASKAGFFHFLVEQGFSPSTVHEALVLARYGKPLTSICGAERADLATKLLDNEQVLSKGKCRYYTWTVCQVLKNYFLIFVQYLQSVQL